MVRRYPLLPLQEAVSLVTDSFPKPDRNENIPVLKSVGRVTYQPVFSPLTLPGVNVAVRDGIAVKSSDTSGAGAHCPVTISDALRVSTGSGVPPEYDAVIKIEDIGQDGNPGEWSVRQTARPWQYIRRCGEDVRAGARLLPAGHRITSCEIGALTTCGITEITVDAVRVGLIPTGNELVPPGTLPEPGQVIESNITAASVWLAETGATPTRYPIVRDDPDLLQRAIETGARESDLVLISAGSSTGIRDFTASAIAGLGEVLAHGIAVKPGRPAIIGRVNDTPVIGLPGSPTAALTIQREIVMPLLASWGFRARPAGRVHARLAHPLTSKPGCDEFIQLMVTRVDGQYIAHPPVRGTGMQMAALQANGYLRIPAAVDKLAAGTEVDARLTEPEEAVNRSLLIAGSRDQALDHLADLMQRQDTRLRVNEIDERRAVLLLRNAACHAVAVRTPFRSPDGDALLREHFSPGDLTLICIAGAQNLHRIPLTEERYELAVRTADLEDERLDRLIRTISSPAFRKILTEAGGYDTTETGRLRHPV
ncbi:hypothetical protein ABH15_02495 [Methanoculleus taiwanensis]|uniref:MoaB/Mog domain-containing protein n=1 Tax=Methanoculleus taiwanensis TaxID=1550565 RepID=A0A498H5N7_9EURY|nr:molybdenum cofactor synthesis domain-containing protein [Methanoculleus taiwanensis]RXE57024.1 hypothetical protein ABH15_02495 [Methanoculleus taiwanensis]